MSTGPSRWRFLILDLSCLGVCAAIVAAGYFLGVYPTVQRQVHLQQARQELNDLQSETSKLEVGLAAERAALARKEERLKSIVVLDTAEKINRRKEAITRLAALTELTLTEMKSGTQADHTTYSTSGIHIQGRGSFAGCVRFLDELARAHRDIAVTGIRMAGNTPADPAATPTDPPGFSFDLVWYSAAAGSAGPTASAEPRDQK